MSRVAKMGRRRPKGKYFPCIIERDSVSRAYPLRYATDSRMKASEKA